GRSGILGDIFAGIGGCVSSLYATRLYGMASVFGRVCGGIGGFGCRLLGAVRGFLCRSFGGVGYVGGGALRGILPVSCNSYRNQRQDCKFCDSALHWGNLSCF